VVDDEHFVATFAGTRLKQLGYQPSVFTEPEAALAAFSAAPDRFHAIVTDLTMPHMTGADLVQHLRRLSPELPAVIMTGYGREAVRVQVRSMRHCVVLPKPYTGQELATALDQVLQQTKK
jgi:DNA-binding NtrC family response regulator